MPPLCRGVPAHGWRDRLLKRWERHPLTNEWRSRLSSLLPEAVFPIPCRCHQGFDYRSRSGEEVDDRSRSVRPRSVSGPVVASTRLTEPDVPGSVVTDTRIPGLRALKSDFWPSM